MIPDKTPELLEAAAQKLLDERRPFNQGEAESIVREVIGHEYGIGFMVNVNRAQQFEVYIQCYTPDYRRCQ